MQAFWSSTKYYFAVTAHRMASMQAIKNSRVTRPLSACKAGAVLPLVAAPEGRGADGVDAMA
jgi:hypothetical protein